MKTGKSIVELANELQRIKDTAKDFIVPVEKLKMVTVEENGEIDTALSFQNGSVHEPKLSNWAHSQMSTFTNVPKAYYDRLKSEAPDLLARNVNHGLDMVRFDAYARKKPASRMIRTVDGKIRGLLSSRYRRLDSFDMAETILPILSGNGFQVQSSEITERRLYIKAVTPKLETEVKKGDVVQFGLCVSNSDVGAGSAKIEPLIFRLVCLNGMISSTAIRKMHIGKDQAGDSIQELLSDQTKELSDAAFWAQVRDVVLASMRPEIFEREVDNLREASQQKITNFDLEEVVELSMDRVGVTGKETKKSIISYLANGADGAGLTKWGLANAFTFAAQADHVDYEQSTELERAGSRVIELPRKDWTRIAESV